MAYALLILLTVACASGLWLFFSWRRDGLKLSESRVFMHGIAAGGVLMALLLDLNHETSADTARLLLVFLGLASGMLLFLQRQRLRRLNSRLAWTHLGLGFTALLLVGFLTLAP